MSYDMSIGNSSFNYTYNVSCMWYDCFQHGIREHYGLTGKQAVPLLRRLREHMENNFERLEQMNPTNGWGDFDGALNFVSELIMASLRNPCDVWEGD